jgi:adenosylhomocysteine nucleosidase
MRHLIVVVGLAFEARIAAGAHTHVICSGDGRDLAGLVAFAIVNCRGLVRFGVAGGFSPVLPAGAGLVGSAIVSRTIQLMTDQNWSQSVLQAIPDPVHGTIAEVPAPIVQPEAKCALKTGVVAIDMESQIVARMAAKRHLPMVALRVIADPTDRRLPQVALAVVRPDGTLDIGALIHSMFKRPHETPASLQTALHAVAAHATASPEPEIAWSKFQSRSFYAACVAANERPCRVTRLRICIAIAHNTSHLIVEG